MLSRLGCHLCEAVEEEIRSTKGVAFDLVVIDIDVDPMLKDKYSVRVPVVTVDGKEVFEAKMMDTDGRWRKRLLSLMGGL